MDPFCGAAFVFRAKRADRIKLLLWDQTGMLLVHKRLEGGKFVWPQVRDGVMRMSSAQFAALFEGVDWRLVRPERARCVFRGDAPTDSDLMRPPVPISSAHRFRGMRPPL
jgi:transposase